MSKLTLDSIGSLSNATTAIDTLDDNFDAIETAVENTLSRDGTSPNQMEAELDMNSNRIVNLPAAVGADEPVRKAEFDLAIGVTAAVPSTRQIIAGTGLTGGGTLATDVTLNLSDTGVVTGSYGTASQVPLLTVSNQGRITTVANSGVPLFRVDNNLSEGTPATMRTSLGLGTMATQAASAVAITGGTSSALVSTGGSLTSATIATPTITTPTITNGTMSGTSITGLSAPSSASDAATKAYVDSVAVGLHPLTSVVYATAAVLPNTPTYSNGASGVGATLTAGSNAAIAVDGASPTSGQRILVKDQASALQNGIYTVTTAGSGAAAWVLTRATDADTNTELVNGSFVAVTSGSTNIGSSWMMVQAAAITMGTTSLPWTQLASSALLWSQLGGGPAIGYSAGKVGIGTGATVPNYNLQVHQQTAANPSVIQLTSLDSGITSTDGGSIVLTGGATPDLYLQNNEAGKVYLSSNGAIGLTVDPSQKVGIGTSSPSTRLHVSTSGAVTTATLANTSTANTIAFNSAIGGGNYGTYLVFTDGATNSATIQTVASGGLHLGTAGSIRVAVDGSGLVGIGTTAQTSTLDVAGSFAPAITVLAANTTLSASHHTILGDPSGGSITLTLPSASTCTRREYVIKKADTTVNTVTVVGTIDGASSYILSVPYDVLKVQSNGAQWWIV